MRLSFYVLHKQYNAVPQGTHEHMKELGSFLEMSSKLKKYICFRFQGSFMSHPLGPN